MVNAPGMVASADDLATRVGVAVLAAGGNAVDAAIATNAALAVVAPHLCGLGGDVLALVHHGGQTHALNASGRAGSGASAEVLRHEGHTEMPFRYDVRSVTLPGCVDGWISLHTRFGSQPLAELLTPAITLAEKGFRVSSLLTSAVGNLDAVGRAALPSLLGALEAPQLRLPGVGSTLRHIAAEGRSGFYEGEFGEGLKRLGAGLFTDADLGTVNADWVLPLSTPAFGVTLHTLPPNSQGYLTLGGASLAENLGLLGIPMTLSGHTC